MSGGSHDESKKYLPAKCFATAVAVVVAGGNSDDLIVVSLMSAAANVQKKLLAFAAVAVVGTHRERKSACLLGVLQPLSLSSWSLGVWWWVLVIIANACGASH